MYYNNAAAYSTLAPSLGVMSQPTYSSATSAAALNKQYEQRLAEYQRASADFQQRASPEQTAKYPSADPTKYPAAELGKSQAAELAKYPAVSELGKYPAVAELTKYPAASELTKYPAASELGKYAESKPEAGRGYGADALRPFQVKPEPSRSPESGAASQLPLGYTNEALAGLYPQTAASYQYAGLQAGHAPPPATQQTGYGTAGYGTAPAGEYRRPLSVLF